MKIRNFLVLAMCAGLAGCFVAANRKVLERRLNEASVRVDAASVCCADFREASIVNLGHEELMLRFDSQNTSVREFDGHKSFFHVVRVPQDEVSEIYFKPQFNFYRKNGVMGSPGSEYLFVPSVSLLNANMQIVRMIEQAPICFSRGWSDRKTGYFLALRINPERYPYMVLWTSPETLASATTAPSGNATMMLFPFAMMSAGSFAAGAALGATASIAGDAASNGRRGIRHGPEGSVILGRLDAELSEHLSKRCPESIVQID